MSEFEPDQDVQEAIETLDRKVLHLRVCGASNDEIVVLLDLPLKEVAHFTVKALRRNGFSISDQPGQASQDVNRALEIMRLDRLQRGLWRGACDGDRLYVDAIERLIDMRASLLGLFPPESH